MDRATDPSVTYAFSHPDPLTAGLDQCVSRPLLYDYGRTQGTGRAASSGNPPPHGRARAPVRRDREAFRRVTAGHLPTSAGTQGGGPRHGARRRAPAPLQGAARGVGIATAVHRPVLGRRPDQAYRCRGSGAKAAAMTTFSS